METWWASWKQKWKKIAAGGAVAGLLAVGAVTTATAPAQSHGGMVFPATRTYNCYLDGLAGGNAIGQGGNMVPNNPICQEALAYSNYPFYTWYGNLLPLVAGRHQETIPDGKLCGPGIQFDKFNTPSPHWPTTALESGDDITFRYAATVPHPGWWYQYITKEGWDPSQPLAWDDLELFDEVLDPPIVNGPTGPEYQWDATLPERSGQHLIFSIWERTDSPESFYNCSDVVFPGGDGDGSDGSGSDGSGSDGDGSDGSGSDGSDGDGSDGSGSDGDGSDGSGSDGSGSDGDGSDGSGSDGGPADPATCAVQFDVNSWGAGHTAEVTVANNTMDAVSGWELAVRYSGSENVQQAWNATVTQTAQTATFRNAQWNSTIAHHGTVQFGYLAQGAPSEPESVLLNGEPCDIWE
ncbi:lytic polysaccharide monooxygenase [Jonesia quinghaiensis]|uniref:lytic polysaccharide monooxygenase n=1 Tax=Jonesia quinghaiensis TaxID=262806 RepID=UPI0004220E5F|nr:lytic polysaccharide monooxygenase [Jonesia quinghaiensis]